MNIDELERLALAATPGPWALSKNEETVVSNQSHPIATISDAYHRQCPWGTGSDSKFIAAANPAAVLDLIERVKAAEQDAERYRFLKSQPNNAEPSRIDVVFWEKNDDASNDGTGLRGDKLDAAIDAQRGKHG